jgi:hypothetical protein
MNGDARTSRSLPGGTVAKKKASTQPADDTLGSIAESLGSLLGNAEKQWRAWQGPRDAVVKAVSDVRDRAVALLSEMDVAGLGSDKGKKNKKKSGKKDKKKAGKKKADKAAKAEDAAKTGKKGKKAEKKKAKKADKKRPAPPSDEI